MNRFPTFPEFFDAVYGYDPFPWQSRLAAVVGDGLSRVDVPTGLGKTAVIDAWVWALARGRSDASRTVPLRLIVAVDRRIVVDSAHARAVALADALTDPEHGGGRVRTGGEVALLREVAGRLRDISQSDIPLEPLRARGAVGGVEWADDPTVPTVMSSTVQQAVSRLLFRGRGVQRRRLPLDAAVAATDSLLVVDEAHLHRPALATVRRSGAADGPAWSRPLTLVTMTATHDAEEGETVRIGPDDLAHPVVAQRVAAQKRTEVVDCQRATVAAKLSAAALKVAVGHLGARRCTVVAVVANTVEVARKTHSNLTAAHRRNGASCPAPVLLTGRSRPWDRDRLVDARVLPVSGPDRDPTNTWDGTVFIVSTQVIEAGPDLDFDGMVTEECPLDALTQRLGRVDRTGGRGRSAVTVVAADKDKTGKPAYKGMPAYGDAPAATSELLRSVSGKKKWTDMGPLAARALSDRCRADGTWETVVAPERPGGTLIADAHLPRLAATGTAHRNADIPIDALLGPRDTTVPSVSVVWRADLPAGLGDAPAPDHDTSAAAVQAVTDAPPTGAETLELPANAFRAWASGEDVTVQLDDLSDDARVKDVNHGPGYVAPPPPPPPVPWGVRRTPDRSGWEVAPAGDVRPGDLFVVPSAAGGCDEYGWDPTSAAPVTDLGDVSSHQPRVRLDPRAVLASPGGPPPSTAGSVAELVALLTDGLSTGDILPAEAARTVADLIGDGPLAGHAQTVAASGPTAAINGSVLSVRGSRRGDDETDDGADTPTTLDDHHRHTTAWARRTATLLSLPSELADAVVAAAAAHDVGKAEPRFQAMLAYGSRGPRPDGPLGKSAHRTRRERHYAANKAQWPMWGRHEAISDAAVALWAGSPSRPARVALPGDDRQMTVATVDWELVAHLVGAHHGHGRPHQHTVADPDGGTVPVRVYGDPIDVPPVLADPRLDAGERLSRLSGRYGWWGLALLEACVSHADGMASRSLDVPTPASHRDAMPSPQPPPTRAARPRGTVPLPGLRIDLSGLAWHAAAGLLVALRRCGTEALLSWTPSGGDAPPHPVVHIDGGRDRMFEKLTQLAAADKDDALREHPGLWQRTKWKTPGDIVRSADQSDGLAAGLLAGFVSDLIRVTAQNADKVHAGTLAPPFRNTSQRTLWSGCAEGAVKGGIAAELLHGRRTPSGETDAGGWEDVAVRTSALTRDGESDHMTLPATTWLYMHASALLPIGSRDRNPGWGDTSVLLPLWSEPLCAESVAALAWGHADPARPSPTTALWEAPTVRRFVTQSYSQVRLRRPRPVG